MSTLGSARHDGDDWDLASSVGATATMVAISRALASRGPHPLIDDRFAEVLVRAVGNQPLIQVLDGEIAAPQSDTALNERQRLELTAVRTRFFDNFLGRATTGGINQVVILASGLDARSYRLQWPSGTRVFEIDLPDVINFKTNILSRMGAEPTAELHSVAIDLRDDWPTALQANGFEPQTATAWVAEGLLMYLPPDAQDSLLDTVTALSASGSRIATEQFSSMSAFSDQRSRAYFQRMRDVGVESDVSELVCDGERKKSGEYLQSLGWQVDIRNTEDLYRQNGFDYPGDVFPVISAMSWLSAELPSR